MAEALFISDLHLSADTKDLNQQFFDFCAQVAINAQALYILGDLFDYWLGDDLMADFEHSIAKALKTVADGGVGVFLLPGNRDFLLGQTFCDKAGCRLLADPTVIELGGQRVLLKHGDDLCTLDQGHQRYRRISQWRWVQWCFLRLSAAKRQELAAKIRNKGRNRHLDVEQTDVVDAAVVKELQRNRAKILIHGHTHRPMIRYKAINERSIGHIVLPDWDKKWGYLGYNCTDGFNLIYS